jgi:predicted secreted protein
MSAIGWIGRALRIGLNGSVLAAVRAKSVRFANTPIDISDGERNGYRRLAEVGDVRSIEVSVDGVTTVDNWTVLRDLVDAEEFAALTIENPDGSTITSDAVIGGLSRTGEHAGAVTFSATFQLSGVLEDGDYLTSEIYPTVVVPPEEMLPPTMLSVAQSEDGVELEWMPGVVPEALLPITGVRIEVQVNGGAFTEVDTIAPESTTYTDVSSYSEGDALVYRVVEVAAEDNTSDTMGLTYSVQFGEFTITAGWDSVAGIKGLYTEDESPPLTYLFGTLDASDLTPVVKACGTLTSVSPDTVTGFLFQVVHTAPLTQNYFTFLAIDGIGTFQSGAADDFYSQDAGGGFYTSNWQFPAAQVEAAMVPSTEYTARLYGA